MDLGCGTGTVTLRLLQQFPQARVIGVDLNPTMLALAKGRLASFGNQLQLLELDLRTEAWLHALGGKADAIVSATALHWLSPGQVAALYEQIARALRPGGLFLNADHVASPIASVQEHWERQRRAAYQNSAIRDADSWDGFWQAYSQAAGFRLEALRAVVNEDQGIEEGMPLTWHFEKLKAAGFAAVDCFWRQGGDAVYGGILAGSGKLANI